MVRWGFGVSHNCGQVTEADCTGPCSIFTQTRLHSNEQLAKPVKSRVREWQVT